MTSLIAVNVLTRSHGFIAWAGQSAPCAVGAGGVLPAADKREGDQATPLGVWPLRRVLYRADRLSRPQTPLPVRPIQEDDGWCDAPEDPGYNRPVRRPYAARHEAMWREDGLYDLVVVLGHNDDPPQAGLGSAIFLHCAKRADGALAGPDDVADALNPTAGCVAMARAHVLALLSAVERGGVLEIKRD